MVWHMVIRSGDGLLVHLTRRLDSRAYIYKSSYQKGWHRVDQHGFNSTESASVRAHREIKRFITCICMYIITIKNHLCSSQMLNIQARMGFCKAPSTLSLLTSVTAALFNSVLQRLAVIEIFISFEVPYLEIDIDRFLAI